MVLIILSRLKSFTAQLAISHSLCSNNTGYQNLAANLNIDRTCSSQLKTRLTGPTYILQPFVCCLPRTKALLSHLSDEITPVSVARWGDGRDPGPCRRQGPTCIPSVLRERQGGQSARTHAVRSRRDTYTDPLSPSYYGHNPEWHFKKNTLASLVCWQYSPMAC